MVIAVVHAKYPTCIITNMLEIQESDGNVDNDSLPSAKV